MSFWDEYVELDLQSDDKRKEIYQGGRKMMLLKITNSGRKS